MRHLLIHRFTRLVIIVPLLAGLVAVGVRAAVRHVQRASAGVHPGSVQEPDVEWQETRPTHGLRFQIPGGTVTVKVGQPRRTLQLGAYGDYHPSDERHRSAGPDARYVPVNWVADVDRDDRLPDYQFRVFLVTDGARYDLRADQPRSDFSADYPEVSVNDRKEMYVVVAGHGEDLRVEVEYDGERQSGDVDSGHIDPGAFAPLYHPRRLTTPGACSLFTAAQARRFPSVAEHGTCDVGTVSVTPYFPTLGWAAPGHVWATVDVLVGAPITLTETDGRDVVYYGVTDAKSPRVTIDGHGPATTVPLAHGSGQTYVFDLTSTPRQVRLTASYVATPNLSAPEATRFRFGLDKTWDLS